MDRLPLELISIIVAHISDRDSWTKLARVSSTFLEPAQQQIFRSFSLTPRVDARLLLETSPHLAHYIREFSFDIPHMETSKSAEELRTLCAVLNLLNNVQDLLVSGNCGEDQYEWPRIPAELRDIFVTFIRRQKLQRLHVMELGELPQSLLGLFLNAATTVSLLNVSFDSTAVQDFPIISTVKNLSLVGSEGDLSELLSSRVYSRQMPGIKTLAFQGPFTPTGEALVAKLAPNLERLILECMTWEREMTSLGFPLAPPPSLPLLRYLRLEISHLGDSDLWLPAVVASLLAVSPALIEVVIRSELEPYDDESDLDVPKEKTMHELEKVILASPSEVRLRWVILRFLYHRRGVEENCFVEFVDTLYAGMPDLYSLKQLVVEHVLDDKGFGDFLYD
ncbi:hypothetical protein R3P38DRAFT_2903008 [Favolaschia claudopus]|uniref:F-box domain-containing protein n=1 Tax=Favolaschia claudopus TaxID=2862362 RepID=A0AAW0CJW3_9AGAR